MAKQTRVSVKDAAIQILGEADAVMSISTLAEKVMATKGVKLEGKTPVATIRKTLDRSADFERPKPGMYRLAVDGQNKYDEQKLDDEPEQPAGDEFAVDLKEAAKAADQKASTAKRKSAAAKPDPKPTSRRKKVNA
jgi:hypothetical protein